MNLSIGVDTSVYLVRIYTEYHAVEYIRLANNCIGGGRTIFSIGVQEMIH